MPANEVCEGYVFTGVCLSTGGGVNAGGHVWQGACVVGVCVAGGHAWQGVCMAGRHVWQEGMCGRGACMAGACMAGGHAWQGGVLCRGGMHGRGHAWQGGMCGGVVCGRGMCGRGACMAGGHAWGVHGGGSCVADTTRYSQWASGTHPTGMHSCWTCIRMYTIIYMKIHLVSQDIKNTLNSNLKKNPQCDFSFLLNSPRLLSDTLIKFREAVIWDDRRKSARKLKRHES